MKKTILALVLTFPILTYAQMSKLDSFPLILLKINPLFITPQKTGKPTFGGTIEYHFKKYFSTETGGEINSEGFAIRVGLKFYSSEGSYFSPIAFYRKNQYYNRGYRWNDDREISPITETGPFLSLSNSGSDCWEYETADEVKQVFGIQTLWGKQILLTKRVPFEYYYGLGLRYKYRVKEISFHQSSCGGGIPSYYTPPRKESIESLLPSFQ
ncbi:MAG: hypothetical protein IT223_12570, partial [Crocinitomicaceae bacterium]|nr:hypothetical protein [Crocinitomicaceae bacterium]